MQIDRDCWSAAGLNVLSPYRSAFEQDQFVLVTFALARSRGGAALPRELCRSLSGWLAYQAGVTPELAQPDVVRLVVDEQRLALRTRSSEDVTEDFRAGLAWGDNALRAVAVAAGEERP